MLLKIKSLLLFSCFLITFCKDYLIETNDNNSSSSNTPSADNYLNDAEDRLGSKDYLIENDDSTSTTRKSCGRVLCKKLLVEFAGKRINVKYKQKMHGIELIWPYYVNNRKTYRILINNGKFKLQKRKGRTWIIVNFGNHKFKNIFWL